MCFAPSAPTLLFHKLRTGVKIKRQGVLTVGQRVCGNVLERSEGGVGLECLRDVLGALITDAVVPQTASESQKDTSGGADVFLQKASTKQQVAQGKEHV